MCLPANQLYENYRRLSEYEIIISLNKNSRGRSVEASDVVLEITAYADKQGNAKELEAKSTAVYGVCSIFIVDRISDIKMMSRNQKESL